MEIDSHIEGYSSEVILFQSYYAFVLLVVEEKLDYLYKNINKFNELIYKYLLDKEIDGELFDAYMVVITGTNIDPKLVYSIKQDRAVCRKYIIKDQHDLHRLSFMPLPSGNIEGDMRYDLALTEASEKIIGIVEKNGIEKAFDWVKKQGESSFDVN